MISSRRGRSSSVSSREDALDLLDLLGLELAHAIAEFHRGRRLDEQRRAEADVSCTMPPAIARPSRRTGITKRPLRIVTEMSATRWCGSSRSISRLENANQLALRARSSRRMRRSAADASSLTVPSSRTRARCASSSAGADDERVEERRQQRAHDGRTPLVAERICVRRDERRSVARRDQLRRRSTGCR